MVKPYKKSLIYLQYDINKGIALKIENELLFFEPTLCGDLQVWQKDSVRSLYIRDKKAIQSQLDMAKKEELLLPHSRAMMSFLLFQEQPKSLLLLGLGGGSIIHFLLYWFPALNITAIEMNAEIVNIAKKYFALSTLKTSAPKAQVNIEISDAFAYLKRKEKKNVNVILVDLHDGKSQPDFLYTADFMAHCFHQLSPGGVLVINLLVENEQEFSKIFVALRHIFIGESICMTLKNQKNIFLFAFKSLSALDLIQLQSKASHYQRKYNIEFESFIDNITKIDAR